MSGISKQERTNRKISAAKQKVNAEVLSLLREAFAIDATIEEACFFAGISDSTYYRYRERNPEVCSGLERLRLTPILTARKTISNSLTQSDSARWFIERKRSDEFATKSKTEHSGRIQTEEVTITEEMREVGKDYEARLKEIIIKGRKDKKPPTAAIAP